ncbi:tyrosine-type recombinase/integrase [Microcystis sp. M112S1]|uniref:tyrosine-type recombinase/integrase n=1 Tax=Microcystis sp. M112S1 TaxID=2771103 RepID=UPI00258FAEA1|nr:tyrosine-type recombinase/integrase [Microcystis sp. M112S1]MCA2950812.1 tyrosine-type recombinase/integrase [Microcystis sp. M112S1]MCA4900902.1 tyrosine-type recombinase/integrase [Cytophagales bacterium]MCA6373913.1 tyrosine-type recombinase/integrase [Cytophagales bacterium]MCA6386126.1 tyrosine-type recombinase/integrase [Cytophagales bacterium]
MFTLHHIEYNHLVKNFADHLQRLGYSKGSQSMLPKCVQEFLYRQEQGEFYDLTQLTSSDIADHHEYLQHRPNLRRPGGLSEMMINHHVYALKLFFNWLQELRTIEENPMSALHFEKPTSKAHEVLTREEITSLYESCDTMKERAILHVYYGCGLRRDEGVKLNVSDLQFRNKMLYVREGKGGKSRAVPMTEKVSEELKAYCYQERKAKPHELSFLVNQRGTRLHGQDVNKVLKKLCGLAQIKKEISLHSLRHSIATHLLEGGLSVEYVRDFLGHAYLESTQRYTHIKNIAAWI